MPQAIVGDRQTEHGGLLTQEKKDRLNHLRPSQHQCTNDTRVKHTSVKHG